MAKSVLVVGVSGIAGNNLARHLEWAATTPAARDQDFNVVDGDVFRWKWMWDWIAGFFGLEPAALPWKACRWNGNLWMPGRSGPGSRSATAWWNRGWTASLPVGTPTPT